MRWGIAAVVGGVALASPGAALAADAWFDAAWKTRQTVRLDEPGIANRPNEYMELTVLVPAGTSLDLAKELRVVDATGAPVPALLREYAGGIARIVINWSVTLSGSSALQVYWGNPAAVAQTYAFPPLPYGIYSNLDTVGATASQIEQNEFDVFTKLSTMSLYDRIVLEPTKVFGRGVYSRDQARVFRFGVVGSTCTLHYVLDQTAIYDDLSLVGFSGGSCTRLYMFGVNSGGLAGPVTAPATTSYISKDLTPNQSVGVTCAAPATPGAIATSELLSGEGGAAGCLVRWNAGAQTTYGTLRYRSIYGGVAAASWSPAYTKSVQRALESILQENRVSVTNVGPPEHLCNGKARVQAPGTETCDGIDNDCDGIIDNGVGLCAGRSEGTACLGTTHGGCGCNADSDCGGTRPHCDAQSRQCGTRCNTDSDCRADAAQPRCGRALRLSDAGPSACVECVADADCFASGKAQCDPYRGVCAGTLPGPSADAGPLLADAGPTEAAVDAGVSPGPSADAGCSCTAGQASGSAWSGIFCAFGVMLVTWRRRRTRC